MSITQFDHTVSHCITCHGLLRSSETVGGLPGIHPAPRITFVLVDCPIVVHARYDHIARHSPAGLIHGLGVLAHFLCGVKDLNFTALPWQQRAREPQRRSHVKVKRGTDLKLRSAQNSPNPSRSTPPNPSEPKPGTQQGHKTLKKG